MDEELSAELTRAATRGTIDLHLLRKKLLLEISELCYQDGRIRLIERFEDVCREAAKRGEKIVKIIYAIQKRSGAGEYTPLNVAVQQSEGKTVAWMYRYENDAFEIFTSPPDRAEHLAYLGAAEWLKIFKFTHD
ncbi:MAG: hypothetical protein QXR92_03365 [Fervidicoccaceae archaeon]